MKITKRIEFDAGHRIPSHNSKCRNVHGHRYVLEVTLVGDVNPVRGESDDGMVLDFGDIKKIILDIISDKWDHAFLVYEGDTKMREALALLGKDHKTVVLRDIPTVENLAIWAGILLKDEFEKRYQTSFLRIFSIRLYETPNSWSDFLLEEFSYVDPYAYAEQEKP